MEEHLSHLLTCQTKFLKSSASDLVAGCTVGVNALGMLPLRWGDTGCRAYLPIPGPSSGGLPLPGGGNIPGTSIFPGAPGPSLPRLCEAAPQEMLSDPEVGSHQSLDTWLRVHFARSQGYLTEDFSFSHCQKLQGGTSHCPGQRTCSE